VPAPVEPSPVHQPVTIEPSQVIDPIVVAPLVEKPQEVPRQKEPPVRHFTPIFAAPLISTLEEGKYYLQIAAYSNEEAVRYELSRIDSSLPRAVMNAGSPENPVYRVLIGPVNLGESGALLYRFRNTHRDAFVRTGS